MLHGALGILRTHFKGYYMSNVELADKENICLSNQLLLPIHSGFVNRFLGFK